MPDREKVIKAYEDFVNGYECFCTSDDYEYEMHKAVLALLKEQEAMKECLKKKCVICPHCANCDVDENGLLKEQEAVEPIPFFTETGEESKNYVICGHCKSINAIMPKVTKQKYCHECGHPVLWEGR